MSRFTYLIHHSQRYFDFGEFVAYQWQQASADLDFTDIPGATEDTLETPVLTLAESGIQYRVLLTVPPSL